MNGRQLDILVGMEHGDQLTSWTPSFSNDSEAWSMAEWTLRARAVRNREAGALRRGGWIEEAACEREGGGWRRVWRLSPRGMRAVAQEGN